LPGTSEKRLPTWPLQLALSLLFVVEVFFVFMLVAEGHKESIPTLVNSVGLLVFCALTWRGIPWSRWLLIAFLVWRVARVIVSMISHLAPGDHRFGGSLLLVGFYVATALVIASPLGRSRMRSAA
jgi:hypothetical protein